MIRKTIKNTQESTFVVHIPKKELKDFPSPAGTGFFISSEGHFLTANHVVDGVDDFSKVRFSQPDGAHVLNVSLINRWEKYDLALLKADFEANKNREFFKDRDGFPFLEIDFNEQLEGTPVYAYGYPLPKVKVIGNPQGLMIGTIAFCPRLTSAVISSKYDIIKPIRGGNDPKFYAIDKTLAYGNSGGPVILTETGRVFAVAVRFQPMAVPQSPNSRIIIPTTYGIVSLLNNIENELKEQLNL
ncbi:MAG: S1 family peptidase [Promethearchaeota archaeon]